MFTHTVQADDDDDADFSMYKDETQTNFMARLVWVK